MNFFGSARRFLISSAIAYVILKALFLSGFLTGYVQQIILSSFIVILTSLGLNVIYGYTGQFSLGHAGFYGIGAYAAAFLGVHFKIDSVIAFIPVLFAGGAAAALIGFIVGVPILRLRDDFLAIATLGFGILVRVLLDNSDKFIEVLGGSRGFIGIPKLVNIDLVIGTTVFLLLITRNLIFSRYGLFWQCIKDDELASMVFGINSARMKLMAFTYGCFLAGIGGALYAYLYSFLHPSNFDFLKSIDFLIIVIVGGMGSITGTICVGFLWIAIIEGLRIALPPQVLELRWVLIPLMLIAVMMWKPYGFFARRESRLLGLGKES
jgi:branched-chain amino acid transport system permease protein